MGQMGPSVLSWRTRRPSAEPGDELNDEVLASACTVGQGHGNTPETLGCVPLICREFITVDPTDQHESAMVFISPVEGQVSFEFRQRTSNCITQVVLANRVLLQNTTIAVRRFSIELSCPGCLQAYSPVTYIGIKGVRRGQVKTRDIGTTSVDEVGQYTQQCALTVTYHLATITHTCRNGINQCLSAGNSRIQRSIISSQNGGEVFTGDDVFVLNIIVVHIDLEAFQRAITGYPGETNVMGLGCFRFQVDVAFRNEGAESRVRQVNHVGYVGTGTKQLLQ